MPNLDRIPDFIPEEREHEYETLIRRDSTPLADYVPEEQTLDAGRETKAEPVVEAADPEPKKTGKKNLAIEPLEARIAPFAPGRTAGWGC